MTKKISVLIPMYNVQNFIERCLTSLFENTIARDCEFIIQNDYSSDNSLSLCRKIISKFPDIDVKLDSNDKNLGVSITRNILLEKIKADYFTFVDSDDYVEKNFLEAMYNCAVENNAEIVGCYRIEEYNNRFVNNEDEFSDIGGENLNKLLQGKIFSGLPCRLVCTRLVRENQLQFPENRNMCEDGLFLTKLLFFAQKTAVVKEHLYHYVHYNDNSLCSTESKSSWEARIQNVIETEKFLSSVSSRFHTSIIILKARTKIFGIISSQKEERSYYKTIFSEIDFALIDAAESLIVKIYVFCFMHNLNFICSVMRFIKYRKIC